MPDEKTTLRVIFSKGSLFKGCKSCAERMHGNPCLMPDAPTGSLFKGLSFQRVLFSKGVNDALFISLSLRMQEIMAARAA